MVSVRDNRRDMKKIVQHQLETLGFEFDKCHHVWRKLHSRSKRAPTTKKNTNELSFEETTTICVKCNMQILIKQTWKEVEYKQTEVVEKGSGTLTWWEKENLT